MLGFWTKVLTRKRCLVNPSVVSWPNTVPMLKVKWVFIWQCLALTYRLDCQVCFEFVCFCPFFIYKMVNTMEFLPITKGVTGRSKSWYFRPFHRSTPPNFMPTWPFRHYILLKRLNAYRLRHLYFFFLTKCLIKKHQS